MPEESAPITDTHDQIAKRWATVQSIFGGVLLGAVVIAWGVQPLLRFMNPAMVAGSTMFIATGLIAASLRAVFPDDTRSFRAPLIFLIAGSAILAVTAFFGIISSGRNDDRCEMIERDMLMSIDRRADDAAMIQALGCRPVVNMMPELPVETRGPAPNDPAAHSHQLSPAPGARKGR